MAGIRFIAAALLALMSIVACPALGTAQTNYLNLNESTAAPAQTAPGSGTPDKASLNQWMNSVVLIRNFAGQGSGFFIDDKGTIVTNAHVVRDSWEVTIETRDGRNYKGKVLVSDPKLDLALVSSPQGNPAWLTLAPISENLMGKEVMVIGAPKGLKWTVTKGIISGLRSINEVRHLQTDAVTNPGSSGGAWVLVSSGQAVGVHAKGFSRMGLEGLNFCISADELRGLLNRSKSKAVK